MISLRIRCEKSWSRAGFCSVFGNCRDWSYEGRGASRSAHERGNDQGTHKGCPYSLKDLGAHKGCSYRLKVLGTHKGCPYSLKVLGTHKGCPYRLKVLGAHKGCPYSLKCIGGAYWKVSKTRPRRRMPSSISGMG